MGGDLHGLMHGLMHGFMYGVLNEQIPSSEIMWFCEFEIQAIIALSYQYPIQFIGHV